MVRELVASGFLNVQHIASEHQLADLFTKGLWAPAFTSLLHQLLGSSASTTVSSDIDSSTSSITASASSVHSANISTSTGLVTGFPASPSTCTLTVPRHVSFFVP